MSFKENNFKNLKYLIFIFILLLALVLSISLSMAHVNSVVITNKTSGGIKGAVDAGNTNIYLSPGVYSSNNYNIAINKNVTITGNSSANNVVIDLKQKGYAFKISKGCKLTLINVTIINGKSTSGGAIYNEGKLSISSCVFKSNTASKNGGAIYTKGSTSITNTIFQSNVAGGNGGAIYNYKSTLKVSKSKFTTNKITGKENDGGAIYNSKGKLYISTSSFTKNKVTGSIGGGGAIGNNGLLVLDSSNFTSNSAKYGGGAIITYTGGSGNILNSQFISNSISKGDGGAIAIYGGTYTIKNSNFQSNIAKDTTKYTGDGGAIYNQGKLTIKYVNFNQNVADDFGGAICNDYPGKISLSRSFFTSNKILAADNDGSAIYNDGTLTATKSVFTNNYANNGGAVVSNYKISFKLNSIQGSEYGLVLYGSSKKSVAKIYNNSFLSISNTAIYNSPSYKKAVDIQNNTIIDADYGIYTVGKGDLIKYNKLINCTNGMTIYGTKLTIYKNIIQGTSGSQYGIILNTIAKNNKVYTNTVTKFKYGIYIKDKSNKLKKNKITYNTYGILTTFKYTNTNNIFVGNKVDIKVKK